MVEHEGFLQAILAAPEEDAPRLIYADWLEDHGDPDRAAFIRVQIELARLPKDDPRRADLAGREKGLLDRHAWEWAGPLGDRVTEWAFRRGFVEKVDVDVHLARIIHRPPPARPANDLGSQKGTREGGGLLLRA